MVNTCSLQSTFRNTSGTLVCPCRVCFQSGGVLRAPPGGRWRTPGREVHLARTEASDEGLLAHVFGSAKSLVGFTEEDNPEDPRRIGLKSWPPQT
jgi:hypothetical protein